MNNGNEKYLSMLRSSIAPGIVLFIYSDFGNREYRHGVFDVWNLKLYNKGFHIGICPFVID